MICVSSLEKEQKQNDFSKHSNFVAEIMHAEYAMVAHLNYFKCGFFYLLNLMGDLVDINAAVVCLLLVVTISALWIKK